MFRPTLLAPSTALVLALLLPGVASATPSVLRVDATAAPGGDGSSWDSAFSELRDALDSAAAAPDVTELWIAAGTYTPDRGTGDRNASFAVRSGLALLGGFAGFEESAGERDPELNETVLSGDLLGDDRPGFLNRADNVRHVVRVQDTTAPVTFDGLRIDGGWAPLDGDLLGGGGGIFVQRGDVVVRGCVLSANSAGTLEPDIGNFGGAIYIEDSGSLRATETTFVGNRATNGGAIGTIGPEREGEPTIAVIVRESRFIDNVSSTQLGGAMHVVGRGELVVERSLFDGNRAEFAGAIRGLDLQRVEIRDSVFRDNFADTQTAAIWLEAFERSAAFIERCVFEDNLSTGGTFGGTVRTDITTLHLRDSVLRNNTNFRISPFGVPEGVATLGIFLGKGHTITNTVFDANFAAVVSAVDLAGDAGLGEIGIVEASITNSTFHANTSSTPTGFPSGVAGFDARVTIDNSVFWGNRFGTGDDNQLPGTGGEAAQIGVFNPVSELEVNHTLVEGLTGRLGGAGNVDGDPLFAAAEAGDLRLTSGSPGVDAGRNAAVPRRLRFDIDGRPRFADDPATPDTGQGPGPIVDMGAHELAVEP